MAHREILLCGNICTAMAYFVLTIQIISFVKNPKFLRLFFSQQGPRDRIYGDLYMSLLSIIVLYSSFIFLCGSTHFMSIIHYYYPDDRGVLFAQSASILSCAGVSVLAALVSFKIFPLILNNLDKFEFTHEGNLQHHDAYLLEAVEMIKESIVILSPELKIARGNKASKLIFGVKAQETSILKCIHPNDQTMFRDSVSRVMRSYNFTPATVEIRVRRDAAVVPGTVPTLIPTIPASPISSRPPISPSNNRRRISNSRVYCADDSASRRSMASNSISQSLRSRSRSHSNSTPSEDEGYMWIECTLCKGARVSAAGNFDYDLKMVSRNIDDRKKQAQYQSLVESTEEKARTNEAKMRYISCIAHDLKTPLQSFSFTMDLLGQTRLQGEQRDYLQQAAVAVDLMRLTISQTMDISKALTGAKLMPRRTTVHLSSVLQRVGVIIRGYGKQVPVSFEVAKNVCDTIITDEEWLWQMILNLLTNACKYTDKGEIALKLSLVADDAVESLQQVLVEGESETERTTLTLPFTEHGAALLCEVIDTGVGVREDKLATLFDAFAQVQDGQVTGTGLGLFGVRTRAEGLGGSCGARPNTQSSTGTGAVIWFSIPYVPDRSFSQSGSTKFIFEDLTPTDISPKGCDYQQPFAFSADTEGDEFFPVTSMDESFLRVEEAIRARQLTAMVVEDSRVVRKLMERVLLKMGFVRVECYENGSKGLEAMMAQQVDIVFSDVQMPIMTGPEMVSRFRKFEAEALGVGRRSRRQVVVAVTANGSECGDHQGFDDLCPKPVNRTDIYHIVNKHMSDFSGNAPTEETVQQE